MKKNIVIRILKFPKILWKKLFSSKKKKTVSVIYLHGVIGMAGRYGGRDSLSLKSLKHNIDRAFDNKNNVAIALSINSPGGSPVQSELISNYILYKAQKAKLPVLTFIEDVAASGGYWLACTGKKIYASESSIVGSIGVITSGFGFVNFLKKIGVERRIITQGENKSIYDPFLPVKSKDVELIEETQKIIHDVFKNHVKKHRDKKIDYQNKRIFSGEFWTGSMAKEFGLVDEINDMYTVLEREYGKDIKICCISTPKNLLKKLFGINAGHHMVGQFFARIKEESFWERYGL